MTNSLGSALADTLIRLLPPTETSRSDLDTLMNAFVLALERGDLGLSLSDEEADGTEVDWWSDDLLATLTASGWLVDVNDLETSPHAAIVRDGEWLRLRRWHQQLTDCLQRLKAMGCRPLDDGITSSEETKIRQGALRAGLDKEQCDAVIALQQRHLVVLTGGPGTGKTSTVVQMLATALEKDPELRIQLSAPTGKAAARLRQAIQQGSLGLASPSSAALASLPAATLHRLLEARGENRFRRNQTHPLELDLVVVDEVSMVDLPLMTALLEALPEQSRLLLLGDAHQLPPVGPGAVLQELNRTTCRQQLAQAAVELRTTYRNNGAIARLAGQLRSAGSDRHGAGLLHHHLQTLKPDDNVVWLEASSSTLPAQLLKQLQTQQATLRTLASELRWNGEEPETSSALTLLRQLDTWVALSPVRRGPWGVEAMHRALLGDRTLRSVEHWPVGTPVLNRQNKPDEGLTNGDIGVIVNRDGEQKVLLDGLRVLHPAQFSGAEPAFALTVHKSQGSQYDSVALLLPPQRRQDPRLTYTGLTRARSTVLLITPKRADAMAGDVMNSQAWSPQD